MTETNPTLRLATTAIAAVLALSTTPLLAQDPTAPDTTVESPLTAPDPLAPASTSDPIVPTTSAPEVTPEAAPVATKNTMRTTKATTVRRTTAARPSAVPAPAAAAPTAVAAEPAPAPIAETAPIAPVETVAVEPAASRQAQPGVFMAIAAAAAVLAALVAALVVLRRRRARREEEVYDDQAYATEAVVAEPVPAMSIEPEPAIARTVEPEPAVREIDIEPAAVAAAVEANHESSPEIDGPVTEVPEGFDLSRFGPHVQAAYNGPTEDNPSLSLKHRLRKAAGMDQMAVREAEAELAAQSAPVEAAAARDEVAPASNDFMLGGNGTKAAIRRAFSE